MDEQLSLKLLRMMPGDLYDNSSNLTSSELQAHGFVYMSKEYFSYINSDRSPGWYKFFR